MSRKFSQEWVAGAFVQKAGVTGNPVSSLTGLTTSSLYTARDVQATNVASFAALTPSSFTGAVGWRGIAVLSAATVQTSVQATAAQSGAVILLQVYNYVGAVESFSGLQVQSVGTGFFNVKAVNSIAPASVCAFAWQIIR